MRAFVNLEGVGHAFGSTEVLSNISLDIAAGSYTVLLGPSGSGKTTLLSVLGGFLLPSRGRVLIEGTDITDLSPVRRPTATVFQDYALFPHMTVRANVGFGLRMRRTPKDERNRRASEALDLVGLSQLADRRPHQLSGGQRQRVALARALVIEPKVLLLDEPLGALDLALRRQMQDELVATQKRVGTAFVHVTHDQEEAMALADMVVVMNAGRIEDAGPPERVYARPASRFTASFMGESTVIEGKVLECLDEHLLIETSIGKFTVAGKANVGEGVAIGVRPECLRFGDPLQGEVAFCSAEIREIAFQGSFKRLHASAPNGMEILIKCPAATAIRPRNLVPLIVASEDLILLTR